MASWSAGETMPDRRPARSPRPAWVTVLFQVLCGTGRRRGSGRYPRRCSTGHGSRGCGRRRGSRWAGCRWSRPAQAGAAEAAGSRRPPRPRAPGGGGVEIEGELLLGRHRRELRGEELLGGRRGHGRGGGGRRRGRGGRRLGRRHGGLGGRRGLGIGGGRMAGRATAAVATAAMATASPVMRRTRGCRLVERVGSAGAGAMALLRWRRRRRRSGGRVGKDLAASSHNRKLAATHPSWVHGSRVVQRQGPRSNREFGLHTPTGRHPCHFADRSGSPDRNHGVRVAINDGCASRRPPPSRDELHTATRPLKPGFRRAGDVSARPMLVRPIAVVTPSPGKMAPCRHPSPPPPSIPSTAPPTTAGTDERPRRSRLDVDPGHVVTRSPSPSAVAVPGLEELVVQELTDLGLKSARVTTGGVCGSRRPPASSTPRTSGCAAPRGVVVRIARFEARTFAELEASVAAVEWGDWVEAGRPTRFRVSSSVSWPHHTGAVAERVHRASGLPATDPTATATAADLDAEPLVVVRVVHDQVTISVDSSGAPLWKRGWRLSTAKAPLRETLAAVLLLAAPWDPTAPLIDPMCGSGTIAVEAALLAADAHPGAIGRSRSPSGPPSSPAPGRACSRALAEPRRRRPRPSRRSSPATVMPARSGRRRPTPSGPASATRWSSSTTPSPISARPGRTGPAPHQPAVRQARSAAVRTRADSSPGWGRWPASASRGRVGLLVDGSSPIRSTGLRLDERLRTSNGGIPVRLVVGPAGPPAP